MSKQIIDDPNHPHYGPIRRMWVILQGLGIEEDLEGSCQSWDNKSWQEVMEQCLNGERAIGLKDDNQGIMLFMLQTYYFNNFD